MRLTCSAFLLLLVLVMSAQSEQNTDDQIIKSSTIILFDASNSMSDNNKMSNAKIAVKEFISELDYASDELALIVLYDCDNITVEQPFTTDQSLIASKIDAIQPTGDTPLGAAIDFAKNYVDEYANGAKKIIQFTDGIETCPYEETYSGIGDIGLFADLCG